MRGCMHIVYKHAHRHIDIHIYMHIKTQLCHAKYACMYPHVHTHTVLSVAVGVLTCQTIVVALRTICYKSCVWTEHKTSHKEAPMSRIREAPEQRSGQPYHRTQPVCFQTDHVSSHSHECLAAWHSPSTPWSRSHPLCRFEFILGHWKAGVPQLSSSLSFLHICRDLCPSLVSSSTQGNLPTGKGLNIYLHWQTLA